MKKFLCWLFSSPPNNHESWCLKNIYKVMPSINCTCPQENRD